MNTKKARIEPSAVQGDGVLWMMDKLLAADERGKNADRTERESG
jgi:hypothetical protein